MDIHENIHYIIGKNIIISFIYCQLKHDNKNVLIARNQLVFSLEATAIAKVNRNGCSDGNIPLLKVNLYLFPLCFLSFAKSIFSTGSFKIARY